MQLEPKDWANKAYVAGDYEGDFGHAARDKRVRRVGLALLAKPQASLPELFPDPSELEAAYNLLRNDAVSWRNLFEAHVRSSLQRALQFDEVLAIHDASQIAFARHWRDAVRKHMGAITSKTQGFYAHVCLLASGTGIPVPAGIAELQPYVHRSQIDPQDAESIEFWQKESGWLDNEMSRWWTVAEQVEKSLEKLGKKPIHVMDREGDSYGLLSMLVGADMRFVIRSHSDRRLKYIGNLREVAEIEVYLGDRTDLNADNSHAPRHARPATLTVRAATVTLTRAAQLKYASWSLGGFSTQPRTMTMNLVEAFEKNPPQGEQPVQWLLLTTEPIETVEQILKIVDIYRRRWLIEEYFKALKTGCAIQKRQMESMPNMLKMLALSLPSAWRLLLLRSVADQAPDMSWKSLLTKLEYKILRGALPKFKWTVEPTVLECQMAIAKLGGHLRSNGKPGWLTLYRGWCRLDAMMEGARLVMASMAQTQ